MTKRLRRYRKCKIVATIGPASSTPKMLEKLFKAGVDVFRLNFSHGSHAEQLERLNAIRAIEREYDHPVAILADLQGPKLRVGKFKNGKEELKKGQTFRFVLEDCLGDATQAQLPHPEIFAAVKADQRLLINDGKIQVKVVKTGKDWIETKVTVGGTLSNNKGVNVPDAVLKLSPITKKDKKDMDFALKHGADWIALSFVQTAEDIVEAKQMIKGKAGLVAKIEKPSAIENLDAIIEATDAIMVARGDLGVEMPPETVPSSQKRMVRTCRKLGKPVIVATQMLESMIEAPTPTRAEASDVATAVYEGADAVMLSAETAAGDFPEEAVTIMNRIIRSAEADPLQQVVVKASGSEGEATVADCITKAASWAAQTLHPAAIVTFTASGITSMRAARERPHAHILSLTENLATARRLGLVWGVHSVYREEFHDADHVLEKAIKAAKTHDFGKKGDTILLTMGVPFGVPGTTNVLRIEEIS